jgi:hypothetical protein
MNEKSGNWFCDKFNSCYPIIHIYAPNRIFWIYDEQYIRKLKLCRINKIKIKNPTEIKGVILFAQYIEDKTLVCNYDIIWKNFEDIEFNYNYDNLTIVINEFIKDDNKIKVYYKNFFDVNYQIESKIILNGNSKFKCYKTRAMAYNISRTCIINNENNKKLKLYYD